jgi:hypothetical protein
LGTAGASLGLAWLEQRIGVVCPICLRIRFRFEKKNVLQILISYCFTQLFWGVNIFTWFAIG